MDDTKEKLINSLKEKSIEAFMLGIEIYNKPTIQYRLEGFAFFICNAWELLLKAVIVNNEGNEKIYYKDKPNRSISLTDCLKKVFTNENDPIRRNLDIIIDLRNTSTHFIIKELEPLYISFLQACVINYSQKIYDFFHIDVTEKINNSFMSLVTNVEEYSETEILGKYGKEIFEKYKRIEDETHQILSTTKNDKLAIKINVTAHLVKSKDEAQLTFKFSDDSETSVAIIKELKDTNVTYPYTQKRAIEIINRMLQKRGSKITINSYSFQQISKYYNLCDDLKYCYIHTHYKNPQKAYSIQVIDFVVQLLLSDPEKLNEIVEHNKTKNS